jgi:hypothetical protein
MGRALCVEGLKVSKVVDIPVTAVTLNSESATKIRDGSLWREITELQDTWLPGQTLAGGVWNQFLVHQCGRAIALQKLPDWDARFESRCEAVMWKITTRGFTLQEVLILAAMNIASAAMAAEKRGQGASQNRTKMSVHEI